jgi:hypothetical protein
MDEELYNLLVRLDNIEISLEDYFEWDEESKEEMTKEMLKFFLPIFTRGGAQREGLLFGIMKTIQECVEREDYEQAEVMNKCLVELEKMENGSIYRKRKKIG